MTGQQLRNSILQEAIHGRLVPNVLQPGEKTARELLTDILAERQKAENAAKGKKAKKLTLSEIEEEPWELPEGWCWCRLGDIVKNRDSERTPLSVSVRERQINKVYDYYGPGGAFDKVEDYLFDKRLLLVGEDGANLLTRSKPNAFFAEGKYWVNNHVHVLDSYLDDDIILDYIAMRINGMTLSDYVTGTAQPKMNQEKMNSIPIPLPPLSIQHSIVEKIESLLPLVEEYDAAQGELKTLNEALPDKLRKSVLQEAIHGRLVPNTLQPGEKTAHELLTDILAERQKAENAAKGKKAKKLTLSEIEEEPWELPEGWCWCRLGDVAEFELGKTKDTEKNKGDLKPYLCTINVRENGIDLSILKEMRFNEQDCEHYRLQKGDLMICEGGDCGRSAVWEYDDMEMYYQNALHRVRFCKGCSSHYFNFIFQLYKELGLTNGRGVGIKHFTQTTMKSLHFPLPPLSIQHSIVEKIEEIFKLLEK